MFSQNGPHELANGQQPSPGSDTPMEPPRTPGPRPRILAKKPARPGDTFAVPGQGSSVVTSLITVALFIELWFIATDLHWIKPLFLRSPLAMDAKLIYVAT